MIRIAVPATTANLGVGFDCFGLALDLYNFFEVEVASYWQFEQFEERFANEDNLFVKAYQKTLAVLNVKKQCCKVKIETHIPVSRGLGSSASLIVAGISAANYFNGNHLSTLDMLEIATSLEGHPDNVAAAIYGGLCICGKGACGLTVLQKQVHNCWNFSLWIPDFELSTEQARKVLPSHYTKEKIVQQIPNAIFAVEAFVQGDESLLPLIMNDQIHEPYRQKLIPGFSQAKDAALSQKALAFIISGSGSSCLAISKEEQSLKQYQNWTIIQTKACQKGVTICPKDI